MNTIPAEIKQLIIKGAKAQFGKGPESVKVSISDNIILVDIKGSLTPLEISLIKNPSVNNKKIIKFIRKQLLESEIDNLTLEIRNITGISDLKLENYMFEIDFYNDRQVMVFICNKSLCQNSEGNCPVPHG